MSCLVARSRAMASRWKRMVTIVLLSCFTLQWLWFIFGLAITKVFSENGGDVTVTLTSWYNSSTICKGFFLEGATSTKKLADMNTTLDSLEWRMGEWFYPPEALYNSNWEKQYKTPTVMHGNDGHETRFLVSQATGANDEVELRNLTQFIQPIEGHLILQDFWNFEMYIKYMRQYVDYYTEEWPVFKGDGFWKVDKTQVRNLKISLVGAVVHTGMDRRVSMTGCANRSDLTNQRDCGFVLKMTYPSRRTLTTGHIEAELSSARTVDDPMYFLPLRIVGPGTISASEYDFRSEKFLRLALNMTSSTSARSRAELQELATSLERSEVLIYQTIIAPTPIEQTMFKRQRKVIVGPFSTPYYSDEAGKAFPVDLSKDLAEVGLTLKLKNIVTTTSNFSGRVLVGGSMKVDMSWDRGTWNSIALQQRPYSVEGIWDTTSDELCMLGYRGDSLNLDPLQTEGTPSTGCDIDWKICIQPVLRRFVPTDSPSESVVLSSLFTHRMHEHGYFTPVRFVRDNSDEFPLGYHVRSREVLNQLLIRGGLSVESYSSSFGRKDIAVV